MCDCDNWGVKCNVSKQIISTLLYFSKMAIKKPVVATMTKLLIAFTLIGYMSLSVRSENPCIKSACNYDTTPVREKIVIQILDEYGKPTAAKIRVTKNDTVYYAPEKHVAGFIISEAGGDVMLDNNRRFAYVEGSFAYHLPETKLRFEVIKGYAYRFYDTVIQVTAQTDSIQIQMQKWFHFPGNKWYSGDVHVHHIDPATALLEMKAEDINVCNILTSDFTHDADRFHGGPAGERRDLVLGGAEGDELATLPTERVPGHERLR